MQRRDIILAIVAAVILLLFVQPASAQAKHGTIKPPAVRAPLHPAIPKTAKTPQTPIDEFETMSPEERRQVLNQLPREEREKLQKRIDKFNALPADQQQTLKNLYNRLHQMPPEREDTVRKAITRFSAEPVARQQAIREELQTIANLPPDERQQRTSTREFRKKFSRKEQAIIRDMAPLLPGE